MINVQKSGEIKLFQVQLKSIAYPDGWRDKYI